MALKGYYMDAHNHAKRLVQALNEHGWDGQEAKANQDFSKSGPHPWELAYLVTWYPYRFERFKKTGQWPAREFG